MFLLTIIGSIGLLALLVGFFLNTTGKLTRKSPVYNSLNLAGAFFLCLYAFSLNNIIFTTLEAIWAIAALWCLIVNARQGWRIHTTHYLRR